MNELTRWVALVFGFEVAIAAVLLLTGCIVVPPPSADHAPRPYYSGWRY